MMSFRNMARATAAASVLGAAMLATPGMAQTAPQPAPAVKPPAAQSPAESRKPSEARKKVAPGGGGAAAREYSTPERMEARIAELHQRLAITPAQEEQWRKLADTMRENAKEVEAKAYEREQALDTMSVIDDLRSYEALAKVHAENLGRLVEEFEPLYASMSPEQKKRADEEFRGYRKRAWQGRQQSMRP